MINDLRIIEKIELLYEKKVILYGAGLYGRKILFMLKQADIKVAFFCDGDSKKWGDIYVDVKIISPAELKIYSEKEETVIIITPLYGEKVREIIKKLDAIQIQTNNIFTKFGFELSFWQNINKLKLDPVSLNYYTKLYDARQIVRNNERVTRLLNIAISSIGEELLIYQPGKVGSSTIYSSLRKKGVQCLHLHRLIWPDDLGNPEFEDIYAGFKNQMVGNVKKIITLVREPLGRELSNFFQRVGGGEFAVVSPEYSFMELCEKFIQQVSVPHIKAGDIDQFEWFDIELKTVFNIDVYAHPFDREEGYSIIRQGNVEVLVLKLEKINSLEHIIGNFVGLPNFKLDNYNSYDSKPYQYLYQNIKEVIRIPQKEVDRYYIGNSRMDHFYSEEEKAVFLKKWKKNIV